MSPRILYAWAVIMTARCSLRSARNSTPGKTAMSRPALATLNDGLGRIFPSARRHGANEDYDTADRLPFVGQPSKKAPGLYVATGFNGWGISNGTAAGVAIADQIRAQPNSWASIFDPMRRSPKGFNQGSDTQSSVADIEAIPVGQGGVIKRGKQKLAVWKDMNGKPHALSASCTHLGCTVTWNNAERTWDCPCHGSMFAADGSVIHGPAVKPLAVKKLPSMRTRRRVRRGRTSAIT